MPEAIDNTALFQDLGLASKPVSKKDSGELGLDQFLELMTTQLNNQDPLEPMDNGEFLGQIAQFGAVSGIEQLNNSFGSFSSSITNGQALQAGGLVGKSVLAPVNQGYLEAGSSIRGRVDLPTSASNIQISVTDQFGQLVRNINLGNQPSGLVEFSWDGIDESGEYASPGTYNIAVTAVRGFKNESMQTQLYSQVNSVSIGSGTDSLTLNLAGSGQLPFSQVIAIQ